MAIMPMEMVDDLIVGEPITAYAKSGLTIGWTGDQNKSSTFSPPAIAGYEFIGGFLKPNNYRVCAPYIRSEGTSWYVDFYVCRNDITTSHGTIIYPVYRKTTS